MIPIDSLVLVTARSPRGRRLQYERASSQFFASFTTKKQLLSICVAPGGHRTAAIIFHTLRPYVNCNVYL